MLEAEIANPGLLQGCERSPEALALTVLDEEENSPSVLARRRLKKGGGVQAKVATASTSVAVGAVAVAADEDVFWNLREKSKAC